MGVKCTQICTVMVNLHVTVEFFNSRSGNMPLCRYESKQLIIKLNSVQNKFTFLSRHILFGSKKSERESIL
jgi:hypothetical protein